MNSPLTIGAGMPFAIGAPNAPVIVNFVLVAFFIALLVLGEAAFFGAIFFAGGGENETCLDCSSSDSSSISDRDSSDSYSVSCSSC